MTSSVTVNSNSSMSSTVETIKTSALYFGGAVAALVFMVAHPIIGPLGSLGCLFAAAYHGILLNYHWRHTREKDKDGNLIDGTDLLHQEAAKDYTKQDAKFEQSDLTRLEHEVQRCYHEQALFESLKWARGLAKCTIPVVGPIWAFKTEVEAGGAIEEMGYGCNDDWDHITREDMLKIYIGKLKQEANPSSTN